MKRVKTKAKRNKKYTLSDKQLDKVKHDVSQQITDRVFTVNKGITPDISSVPGSIPKIV